MKKKILVAPLNWGIGHATRCIPIIHWLLDCHFEPIIASDGDALQLLKKEFKDLTFETLPSYNIEYSKKRKDLKWKLIAQTPKMLKAKKAEKKITDILVDKYNLSGIISDNRLGVRSAKIPSVFITHQLNVLSGNTSKISTKIHEIIMNKFDAIWVPDFKDEPSLSGKLGHLTNKNNLKVNYLGPLSRLNKIKTEVLYDVMVLLSGPEPQRSILEKKLIEDLTNFTGKILFVKGKIKGKQTCTQIKQFTIYNYMTSQELEKAINGSKIVICRSGYTTVMDLAKLSKNAFFIPTPGQFEQEYLAERFNTLKIVPSCSQENFNIDELKRVMNYKGLNMEYKTPNTSNLFRLF
ncbi:glycosyltransferase [Lacinutrix venerupis]|uniref:Glycosyltransferase n=1 Tax=Lacinutrix venerupis TaxID=1486034 RepID=A0AAC9LIZ1_9FLAO|nr:glycosyltransferase [Lacinutrix venerupis]APX99268.1 glycosyltransferase [Lacinutrix venerupis]